MRGTTFSSNLTYACSLLPSIADVCRRIGINRQQFNKYLAGGVRPSRHNMHRICDFFGVTESEMLADHSRFCELISVRRPSDPGHPAPPWADRIGRLLHLSGDLSRYLGCYYRYFYTFGYPGKVTRSLGVIGQSDGVYTWKNVEIMHETLLGGARSAGKYEGLVFRLGDRIYVLEYESLVESSITQMMLYPAYQTGVGYMTGIQTGGSMKRGRKPAASSVLLEHLGQNVDLRRALRRCGTFEASGIDPAILELIDNRISPEAYVFEVENL